MLVLKPNFKKRGGLIQAVVQEVHSGAILYSKQMFEGDWLKTLQTGRGVYRGVEHGTHRLTQMLTDCDGDAVVCKVITDDAGDDWTPVNLTPPDFASAEGGYLPVIARDSKTLEVVMLAYTDEAGLRETCETRFGVYYSTSRKKRWKKGEEKSGNLHTDVEAKCNSGRDGILYSVTPVGPSCDLGARSCFFRSILVTEGKPYLMDVPQKLASHEILESIEVPVHENFLQRATA